MLHDIITEDLQDLSKPVLCCGGDDLMVGQESCSLVGGTLLESKASFPIVPLAGSAVCSTLLKALQTFCCL